MREMLMQLVWDIVRLALIPLASVLALNAIRWVQSKVEQTNLGKRLKIDEVAAGALARFIIQTEHKFGAAKSAVDAGWAKVEVMAKFKAWLQTFGLEAYYSDTDRAAFLEWVLDRLGLFGQSKPRAAVSASPPTKPRIVPKPGTVVAPPDIF